MKYSTSTVTADGEFVPWLSAAGALAYTPESAPDRDYFFQYGWVLPGVLNPDGDLRCHRYFGTWRRDDAREIFEFWKNARAGKSVRVYVSNGRAGDADVSAPIAVYRHVGHYRSQPGYMLIQHGSYQFVSAEHQPEFEQGYAFLYRGLQNAAHFCYPVGEKAADAALNEYWSAYVRTQVAVLSDSALSFNSIHDRAMRAETGGIRDGSLLTDEIALRHGLPIGEHSGARALWATHQQSFSLDQGIAEWKFGPNYVVAKTPVTNLRILTFFAGESEVKVLDPRKIEIVRCVGCAHTGLDLECLITH